MESLFGTDGIRGVAGKAPLDESTVSRVGVALIRVLGEGSGAIRVLVGRDTRESGPAIERALWRGVVAAGAELVSGGILPTPAIAYLTRHCGYDAGVVISASHNPFQDNGIKVFSSRGEKLADALEARIEAMLPDIARPPAVADATMATSVDLRASYIEHLRSLLGSQEVPRGLRIAVDCANGATASVAPEVFASLGIEVCLIGNEPDGRNINQGCGSTAPERLAATVVDQGCDLGVAYDGDGDRVMFVDDTGQVVNGDVVLYLCATHLKSAGVLRGNAIVATVMSNIGLELALSKNGITLVRCPVGDKYVMRMMRERDLSLGGEQSGHIIFSDDLPTGDGLGTSIHVLEAMASTGRSLRALASELATYPQVLLNLRVAEKVDLSGIPGVSAVIDRVAQALTGRGRLLVRYSGTEPLLRVMLEGQDDHEIRQFGEEIVAAVRTHVGEDTRGD